ncbi:MAG: hypothetical protein CVT89_02055 [Candidatus Altiarchaeales archaeon HGW-Altiarchaeales-2]|nr:MAG: hypothetical protein CVT89_02055 [Candidatus Altiarchaeales archaeon HGW-Altiarchaeales-2]
MKEIVYAKLSQRTYSMFIDLGLLVLPVYLIMTVVWNIVYIISEKNFPEIYNAMQTVATTPGYISPVLVEIYAIPVIAAFLLVVLYFAISEVRMSGQSIGKIIMNVKVISENSDKYSYKRAFIRNFLRVLDFPFGFMLIAKTKKKQRAGDIFSNTVIVIDG